MVVDDKPPFFRWSCIHYQLIFDLHFHRFYHDLSLLSAFVLIKNLEFYGALCVFLVFSFPYVYLEFFCKRFHELCVTL
jgi:hypothetical protein